jgi:hypothetical protein
VSGGEYGAAERVVGGMNTAKLLDAINALNANADARPLAEHVFVGLRVPWSRPQAILTERAAFAAGVMW